MSIRDTPPNGVAVLFFEASITGVSLQSTYGKKPAVSLMNAPVEVEFGHLQTDTAFLSLGSAAPDSYQNATLTFGNAVLTIVNHSGMAIDGCKDNSVCQLTPSFNPTTATVTDTPFPLNVGGHFDVRGWDDSAGRFKCEQRILQCREFGAVSPQAALVKGPLTP